jgi:hypothetical protein
MNNRTLAQRLRDNAELDAAEHGNPAVIELERDAADHIDHLEQIIAAAYQLAGAVDAPLNWLDVLSDPCAATQEQIDALLPFSTIEPLPFCWALTDEPGDSPRIIFGERYANKMREAGRKVVALGIVTDYAALERQHLGDPDKGTGIYHPENQPAPTVGEA